MINLLKDLVSGPSGFQNATLKEPEWWRQTLFTQNKTAAGVAVTPDSAMSVSAVYGCVRILAETIASLPLKIYESDAKGNRQIASHPLNALLGNSSNGEQTAFELREFIMTNLGLRGNAYSQLIRRNGVVVQINPLNSRYMNIDRDSKGELVFDYHEGGNANNFKTKDIWRVAGLGSNGVTGLSPISLAREGVGAALATESLANYMYANGAQTSGTLEFEKTLTPEQIENLRNQFAEHYQGTKNSGKPLILESGMSYSAVGMTARDSQFIESRKFQITEIARWYRVPPHMLAELSAATFSNIEHQSIDFVVHTIRPWLVRLEQTIWRDLLTQSEKQRLYASHTVEGLLRGDTATRYEAYGKGITDGWMNRNEARAKENLPSIEGLSEFILPLNMASQSEREQSLTDSAAMNMASKEIKALQLEADRMTPSEFMNWLPSFYLRHKENLSENMATSPDKFRNYIDKRIADFEADPAFAMQDVQRNAQQQIKGVIYE